MQVVILAGGMGTRLNETSDPLPKPMTQIGEFPIIWHIMKYYYSYGHSDFLILMGYKSYAIKNFFMNYRNQMCNVTINPKNNKIYYHEKSDLENWNITLVDTGLKTMTAGRLKMAEEFLEESFMVTYGDGLSNVNLDELFNTHNHYGKLATITAVHQPGRFGVLKIENELVSNFDEKGQNAHDWINGGFMVLDKAIIKDNSHLTENSVLEIDILPTLANKGELAVHKHLDFWQPMDTPRDRKILENLWQNEKAPWKKW